MPRHVGFECALSESWESVFGSAAAGLSLARSCSLHFSPFFPEDQIAVKRSHDRDRKIDDTVKLFIDVLERK